MSERNGDKARFGRIRKKRIIQRLRSRKLSKDRGRKEETPPAAG